MDAKCETIIISALALLLIIVLYFLGAVLIVLFIDYISKNRSRSRCEYGAVALLTVVYLFLQRSRIHDAISQLWDSAGLVEPSTLIRNLPVLAIALMCYIILLSIVRLVHWVMRTIQQRSDRSRG